MLSAKFYFLSFVGFLASALIGTFVWPTAYRNDHLKQSDHTFPVRIHRFSGKTEILYPEGWRKVDTNQKTEALPTNELDKLETTRRHGSSRSSLEFNVYNGSSYSINEITVHIKIISNDDPKSPLIDRDYRIKQSYMTGPLEDTVFEEYLYFEFNENQKLNLDWHLVGASGVKQ